MTSLFKFSLFGLLLTAAMSTHAAGTPRDVEIYLARLVEYAQGTPTSELNPIEKKFEVIAYSVNRSPIMKSTQLRPVDTFSSSIEKLSVNISTLSDSGVTAVQLWTYFLPRACVSRESVEKAFGVPLQPVRAREEAKSKKPGKNEVGPYTQAAMQGQSKDPVRPSGLFELNTQSRSGAVRLQANLDGGSACVQTLELLYQVPTREVNANSPIPIVF